ncbi:HERC1 [Symbiodinium natans]|uniref:HERC1 protein n=1 Tax=Symbiodinium natans TaxID=878477 RepID=A0A812L576_9DINO|nr:HERC1 [Symbiodinium natans]
MEVVVTSLEEKVARVISTQPTMEWRLAELSASVKGLQEQLETQACRTDAAEARLQRWKASLETEMKNLAAAEAPAPPAPPTPHNGLDAESCRTAVVAELRGHAAAGSKPQRQVEAPEAGIKDLGLDDVAAVATRVFGAETAALKTRLAEQQEALRSELLALAGRPQAQPARQEADVSLHFGEIRALINDESASRSRLADEIKADMRDLAQELRSEADHRLELQQRLEALDSEAKSDLQQAEQRRGAAAAELQVQAASRGTDLGREDSPRGQKAEAESQIVSLQSASQDCSSSLKELDPAMKALFAEACEVAQKQHLELLDRLTQLSARVDAEMSDRQQADDKWETLQEALGREQLAREGALSENSRAVGALASRLDSQEKALPELDAAVKAELAKVEAAMASFRQEERNARETMSADLSATQAQKHEEMTATRREHAALKEESRKQVLMMAKRPNEDLHTEHECLLQVEAAPWATESGHFEDASQGQTAEEVCQIVPLQCATPECSNGLKELDSASRVPVPVAEEGDVAQRRQLELLDRLTQLTARVDAEKADRQEAEERAGDKLETLQEALGREQLAREAALSENFRAVGALASRLDSQERALPELDAAVKAELAKVEAAMASFRQEERNAREATSADLSASQVQKHEAMAEEMRREHATLKEESRTCALPLVERLNEELRNEHEARLTMLLSAGWATLAER